MTLLKYNGNLISTGTKVLKYVSTTQEGYWVHKDTGVKTYFGLEDPSIENGMMGYPSLGDDCSEVNIPD